MKFRDFLNLGLVPFDVELRKRGWSKTLISDLSRLSFPQHEHAVIIDCGAHEGETLAQLVPEYPNAHFHSFEPFPAAFENLQQHWGTHSHVTLHPDALGDQDNPQEFHLNADTATNSLLAADPSCDYLKASGEIITINQKRIDSFMQETSLERIDLLKLDCQGYEKRVLAGGERSLSEKAIGLIYSEVNFIPQYEQQAYFDEITGYLRGFGYGLISLYEGNRSAHGHHQWSNALYAPLVKLALSQNLDL